MDSRNIHFELFTAGKAGQVAAAKREIFSSNKYSTITLKLDGIASTFRLAFNGDNILDAAMQQGANLPYACKGGVCTTCKAKLLEGKVTMDVNWGLEPDEVEKGYVLTCQSHPQTERVTLDFDAK